MPKAVIATPAAADRVHAVTQGDLARWVEIVQQQALLEAELADLDARILAATVAGERVQGGRYAPQVSYTPALASVPWREEFERVASKSQAEELLAAARAVAKTKPGTPKLRVVDTLPAQVAA